MNLRFAKSSNISKNLRLQLEKPIHEIARGITADGMSRRTFLWVFPLAVASFPSCVRNLATSPRRPRVPIAILDFDGVLTDVEKEGIPFTEGYKRDLAVLLKGSPVETLWAEADAERISRQEEFAWNLEGFLTAPASDPYLRVYPITDLIFDKLGLYTDPQERRKVWVELYLANYGKSTVVFKPGAKEYLEEMVEHTRVIIVTNSETKKVVDKLETLSPRNLDRIMLYGNAKKYQIDPAWDYVPEGQEVEGLNRLVLLRRKNYFEVLTQIAKEFGVPISEMRFMGDVYDLDLALPQYLGASTALITREGTYSYEKRVAQTIVHNFEEAKGFFYQSI